MERKFAATAAVAALACSLAAAIAAPPTAPAKAADPATEDLRGRVPPRERLIAVLPGSAPAAPPTWSETTTAAATGYCLAKHPYRTLHSGAFTPDGFEIVASPGIVGAVRRNYMHRRLPGAADQGQRNTCPQACAQFGRIYGPAYAGAALRQKVAGGALIHSGLGDLGALAMPDRDFYLDRSVIAGMWSRGNTWHESDVAQADYCCCQAKAAG